jgi:hypothetical protein
MRTNIRHDASTCRKGNCIDCLREERTPIIEACSKIQVSVKDKEQKLKTEIVVNPCDRIDGEFCSAYAFPDKKWRLGPCNAATHLFLEQKRSGTKKLVTPLTIAAEEYQKYQDQKHLNPLKASKRRSS